jgi:type IV pilus assembly protein PilO
VSTTNLVPTPDQASFRRRVPEMTARTRALITTMNLHFAGIAVLILLDLFLIIHLVFVWQALNARNADALDQQRAQLIAAEIAAKPLRGLDKKLVASTAAADQFSETRLPYATSEVAAELGVLTKREGVHLARVQYAYDTVLSGNDALVEDRIDASISGDYRPVVQFINAAERDKVFFVINGINLTGQQTGQVNLRIRMTTYLRQPISDELSTELPTSDSSATTGGKP